MLPLYALAHAASVGALPAPAPAASTSSKHYAVIVSVATNTAWSALPSAARDAAAFWETATDSLGVPEGNVTWLEEPRTGDIARALNAVPPTAEVVWVYYAGHAFLRGGELHVIGTDTPALGKIQDTTPLLAESELASLVRGKDVRVLVDACNPGERALVPVDAPVPSGLHWRATQPAQYATDLPGTGHGAYAYYLNLALRGYADGEGKDPTRRGPQDLRVTTTEARLYVDRGLRASGHTAQQSDLRTYGNAELVLATLKSPPPPLLPAPDACMDPGLGVVKRTECNLALRTKIQTARARVQAEASAAWKAGMALDPVTKRLFYQEFVRDWQPRTVEVDGLRFAAAPAELVEAWTALGKGAVPPELRGARPDMVKLPGGSFFRGRFPDEESGDEDELPAHLVTVSPFELANAPVTNRAWKEVEGKPPDLSCWPAELRAAMGADDLPVTCVSWCAAVAHLNKLTLRIPGFTSADLVYEGVESCGATDSASVVAHPERRGLRLPSEAEWQYAGRAGTREAWPGTSDPNALKDYANASGKEDGHEHLMPVYEKRPNRFGLYGMAGNVWHWLWDWWGPYALSPFNPLDPQGLRAANPAEPWRSLGGGSWWSVPAGLRVANRSWFHPGYVRNNRGFRPARSSR